MRVLALLTTLVGCGPRVGVEEPPRLYDRARVLEVELTLDVRDWDALRAETRSLWDVYGGDCLAEPQGSPFTWYVADAVVGGVPLGEIEVRKKGLLGSLSDDRPSLKLDLGFDALTLNNGRDDPTALRTCLGYATFAALGVPASECTLAHVTVNGVDLGVYSNVEPLDARFLERRGLAVDGGLFEGTLSDFRDGWTGTFEPKTDASDVARLDRVVDAVASGDLDTIGAVVDLDAYFAYWTAEVLAGQWDGYNANTNNFFVYDDPESGQIQFLPWGPDAVFKSAMPFAASWVAANAALPRAVLLASGGEAAYRAHLDGALDAWDGEAMTAELDRLAELAAPFQGDVAADVRALREVIVGREDTIRAGLAGPPGGRTGALREPPCFVDRGTIAVTFETSWDTLDQNPWSSGAATIDLTWEGVPVAVTAGGAVAGPQGGTAVIATYASTPDGELVAYAYFPVELMAPGEVAFDFARTIGVLRLSHEGTGSELAAYVGHGSVSLESAPRDVGSPVRGVFQGTLFAPGW